MKALKYNLLYIHFFSLETGPEDVFDWLEATNDLIPFFGKERLSIGYLEEEPSLTEFFLTGNNVSYCLNLTVI